jgi:predicted transcriptional regulator
MLEALDRLADRRQQSTYATCNRTDLIREAIAQYLQRETV